MWRCSPWDWPRRAGCGAPRFPNAKKRDIGDSPRRTSRCTHGGRIAVFRGITSHQRPPRVSYVVHITRPSDLLLLRLWFSFKGRRLAVYGETDMDLEARKLGGRGRLVATTLLP